MPGLTAADMITLGARIALAAFLYILVAAVLWTLRREIEGEGRRDTAAVRADGPSPPTQLTLMECGDEDGPLGRRVTLSGELVMGRRAQCQVVLRDDAVSGRHARFERTRSGWIVEDLDSTNGTFVNGQRVRGAVTIRAGDVVTIGKSAWRVEAE